MKHYKKLLVSFESKNWYQNFDAAKDETSMESVDIGVRDKATDEGEQERATHEVCDGVCSTSKVKVHYSHEV